MRRARQVVNRHPSEDPRRDVQLTRRLLALMLIRRRDKLVLLLVAVLRRRVTWSNYGRKHDFVNAVSWNQEFGVAQFDLDLFLRHDVGQTHREDVWPLLFEQGSALPFLFGFLELLLRFLAFFDLRDDDLVADLHAHGVDRGARRRRENVRSIDGTRTFVTIDLP